MNCAEQAIRVTLKEAEGYPVPAVVSDEGRNYEIATSPLDRPIRQAQGRLGAPPKKMEMLFTIYDPTEFRGHGTEKSMSPEFLVPLTQKWSDSGIHFLHHITPRRGVGRSQ